jgi:hypothetical protein
MLVHVRAMTLDVWGLVRGDHDDLDRALTAMVDPATPPKELANLLEVFRLALAVHAAAESAVFDLLLTRVHAPRTLGMLATQTRVEHVAQRMAADALHGVRPASLDWYEHALQLRVLVVDHALRANHTRWTLLDHVPAEVRRALASEYATERMRVLASTSPLLLAQRRDTTTELT